MPARKRILIVDDDPLNRKVLGELLSSLGLDSLTATCGREALKLLDDSIDLVLMDVMMPEMNGYETTRRIRAMAEYADLPVIIVTTLSSMEDRLAAVEAGANDFIAKPIDFTELKVRTASLLKMKESHDALKRYRSRLEDMVRSRTRELVTTLDNLRHQKALTEAAHLESIRRLAAAAEFKDEDTAQHLSRMSRYAALLAETLGLPESEVDLVLAASPMHDVGKIGIPDAILLKPGKLTAEEWQVMQTHTTIGAHILRESDAPVLQTGCEIALTHHERFDGSGYPAGLSGEGIPLKGRICAVADVFDALTSRRPYKEAYPVDKALDIMRKGRGSHFDPHLLDCFLERMDVVRDIMRQFPD